MNVAVTFRRHEYSPCAHTPSRDICKVFSFASNLRTALTGDAQHFIPLTLLLVSTHSRLHSDFDFFSIIQEMVLE